MTCYRPIQAWKPDEGGSLVFHERRNCSPLVIPCGQCIGCRLERSRQWATRCLHESQLHDFSSFVTLTYSDDFLPSDMSLNYYHFQCFMKRLRKRFGQARFYMCGEYGEQYLRPHYHACVFGVHFSDRQPWKCERSGFQLYRSATLDALWPFGHSSVGDVTFESAAYVARYCMKKVTGDRADAHYSRVSGETGEVFDVVPEFTRMSLKPGIGQDWIRLYYPEVLAHGNCIVRGHPASIPRYYKNYLRDTDEYQALEKVWYDSLTPEVLQHTTPDRLQVRERVAKAAFSMFSREIE